MSKLFIYCNYSILFNDLLYWQPLPSRYRPKIVRFLIHVRNDLTDLEISWTVYSLCKK